jgi:hypothetical protein
MNLFQKQPADQLDYDLDFSDWLTDDDILTGAVATSSVPEELIVQSVRLISPLVKIWIAGGVSGATYKITATITTSQGRIKELEFKIRVREL